MRLPTIRAFLIALSAAALVAGVVGSAGAQTVTVLGVYPPSATVPSGGTLELRAFECPPLTTGEADVGPDGMPGTDDDDCVLVSVSWSTTNPLFGSVSPSSGSSTTFTAALPSGSSGGTNLVVANDGARTASALIVVTPPPMPIIDLIYVDPLDPPPLRQGQTRSFSAFRGPANADGTPDLGDDGMPATLDDDFQLRDVFWEPIGGIGTVAPANGSSTVFTATTPGSGQVRATDADGLTAAADVTVTPSNATDLVYIDPAGEAVDTIELFQPALVLRARIVATQIEIRLLEGLLALLGGTRARPALERRLDLAIERLQLLVPVDARYAVAGPGANPLGATLTSFDPTGNALGAFPLTLRPSGGRLESGQFVVFPRNTLLAQTFGGLLFVPGVRDGHLNLAVEDVLRRRAPIR
jgi:hypothetical protein